MMINQEQEELINLARIEFDYSKDAGESIDVRDYETRREIYVQERLAKIEKYPESKRKKLLETNVIISMLERIYDKTYGILIINEREYKEKKSKFIPAYLIALENSDKSLSDCILRLEELLRLQKCSLCTLRVLTRRKQRHF